MKSDNRVIVGALIAIVMLTFLYLGKESTSILLALVCIIGAIEIERATSLSKNTGSIVLHILSAAAPSILLLVLRPSSWVFYVLVLSSLLFNIYLAIDLVLQKRFPYKSKSITFTVLYLGLPTGILISSLLHSTTNYSSETIGILFLIWTCDTMAYFVGKAMGKTKLFPSVSPNKTVEGSIGGGIFSVLVALIIAKTLGYSFLFWMGLAVVIWIAAGIGDLVESKFKRSVGIKDSGTILKGHGGILDRFDSLIYIIPFVLCYFYIFAGRG